MSSNALFFPYVSVPEEAWTIKTLLYWDKLSSIVPLEYIQNPNDLGDFTQKLVQESLLEQVFPAQHIHQIPEFSNTFINYLESDASLQNDKNLMRVTSRIHAEKLGNIPGYLVDRGLATQISYSWYDVDSRIADLFMTYLASCLGAVKEVNAAPVTNQYKFLRLFNKSSIIAKNQDDIHRNKARDVILSNLLPIPDQKVNLDDLLRFKNDHGHMLPRLRTKIESACATISSFENANDRLNATNEFVISSKNEINEIEEAMRPFWRKIKAGTIGSIVGSGGTLLATTAITVNEPNSVNALATLGAVYTFKSCIEQAISGMKSNYESSINATEKPLAYIIHAQNEVAR